MRQAREAAGTPRDGRRGSRRDRQGTTAEAAHEPLTRPTESRPPPPTRRSRWQPATALEDRGRPQPRAPESAAGRKALSAARERTRDRHASERPPRHSLPEPANIGSHDALPRADEALRPSSATSPSARSDAAPDSPGDALRALRGRPRAPRGPPPDEPQDPPSACAHSATNQEVAPHEWFRVRIREPRGREHSGFADQAPPASSHDSSGHLRRPTARSSTSWLGPSAE